MDINTCSGIDALTGQPVRLSFSRRIESLGPAPRITGPYLSPGWIDIQVNGFAGADYCSPETSNELIAHSIEVLWSTGVARVFPTVITGSAEGMAGAIRNLARAKASLPIHGRSMEGFHIEGPHISPDEGPRGAHPVEAVRAPDTAEFDRWMDLSDGHIKMITIAPEWRKACTYIEHVVARGVVAAIGHTNATGDQIRDAVSAGATTSTHLGNGAHMVVRRHPNYIWEQLAEDRLAASFIVDGIHLPKSFIKPALRAKGIERSILTTDAVMPAGCPPGRYRLGEVEVELHADDRVTLVGKEKLAGSSLRMDRGVERLIDLGEISLPDAIRMSSVNPARYGRVEGRTRGLEVGERADILQFEYVDGRVAVCSLTVDGETVYRA
jgi:N-acetylglucosamine-6-phosphate deacetylase